MRLLIAATIILALSGRFALAQRRAPGILIAPRPRPHAPHYFPVPILVGGPWYPGYANAPVPPPEVIVIQAPAPPAPIVKEDPKPITPLMIEWHDGRYVRSDRDDGSVKQIAASANVPIKAPERAAKSNLAEIAPALLIFRDGHRERVREYTIADGAIYARGDYWVDGYWNKKILLSALDVPATVSANHGNGSKFELPSGPNVIVVRP